MKNKRLEAITTFLSIEDKFIDIGCDHAYVPIYMAKKGSKKILATDVHENALEIARQNVLKEQLENIIELKLSDGLEKLDTKEYNTLVIAGMGMNTIQKILASDKGKLHSIDKIILQSNNDLPELRMFMNTLGYFLKDEKVIYERNHYYVIMCYIKGAQKLTLEEINFGLYSETKDEYYHFLEQELNHILIKIPEYQSANRKEIEKKIKLLQKFKERRQVD